MGGNSTSWQYSMAYGMQDPKQADDGLKDEADGLLSAHGWQDLSSRGWVQNVIIFKAKDDLE